MEGLILPLFLFGVIFAVVALLTPFFIMRIREEVIGMNKKMDLLIKGLFNDGIPV